MKNNIIKFLENVSTKDTSWIEMAEWRKENEIWLCVSFNVAVEILSKLYENNKTNTYPKNEFELAKDLNFTKEKMHNILKGVEKLDEKTISDIENALKIKIKPL